MCSILMRITLFFLCPRSSAGQSGGLLIRRPQVRFLSGVLSHSLNPSRAGRRSLPAGAFSMLFSGRTRMDEALLPKKVFGT